MKTNITIVGNMQNEEKFLNLSEDERFEIIKDTMNSITNILVFSGIPADNFPSVLRAQAALLEDKIKTIRERGKQ